MTLRYSRRSFRKVVWKSSKEVWCRSTRRLSVIWRVHRICRARQPQRGRDQAGHLRAGTQPPVRGHASPLWGHRRSSEGQRPQPQRNSGKRDPAHARHGAQGETFESIDEQNQYLMHWEEKWAAQRIHGEPSVRSRPCSGRKAAFTATSHLPVQILRGRDENRE